MPNLYKQYFVHNEPNNKRVINSDDIVEKRLEKMAELKRREQKTTDENGFSAGIVGPDTDYVEEIDHAAEAKKEAEKILAEAQAVLAPTTAALPPLKPRKGRCSSRPRPRNRPQTPPSTTSRGISWSIKCLAAARYSRSSLPQATRS